MTKVNKILILFMAFVLLIIVSIWQMLQSEILAQYGVRKLNDFLEKKEIPLNVSFQSIDLDIFPPAVKVNNVEVEYMAETIQLHAYYQRISAEINPYELLRRADEIDKVTLDDGVVRLKVLKTKDQTPVKKEPLRVMVPDLAMVQSLIPIRLNFLEIKKTDFIEENGSVFIEKLLVGIDDEFEVDIDIKNIRSPHLGMYNVDNLKLAAILNGHDLAINNLEIKKGLSRLRLHSKLHLNKDLMLSEVISSSFYLESPLSAIHDYFEFEKVGVLEEGDLIVEGGFNGFIDNLKTNARLNLRKFQTSFFDGERIEAELFINNQQIRFESARVFTDKGHLSLLSPFEFFNFKSLKFVEDPVLANVENINLNQALKYLGDSLEPLKGDVSGRVTFILNENDFHFLVEKGANIKNLALKIDELEIVGLKNLDIERAQFDIYGTDFYMKLAGQSEKSVLNVDGRIVNSIVDFKTFDTLVDFSDFQKIAGIDIAGFGELDLRVHGHVSNAQMDIITKLQNFEFFEIKFNTAYSKLLFELNQGKITIDELIGEAAQAKVNGYGSVDFNNNFIDLSVSSKEITVNEFIDSFALISKPLLEYRENVDALMDVSGHIYGGFSLEAIQVDANLTAKNILLYNESFDDLRSKIRLDRGELLFNEVAMTKGEGEILGDANINLLNQDFDWDFEIKKILTSDLFHLETVPLSFTGELNGETQGHWGLTHKNVDAKLFLNETRFESELLDDSTIEFRFDDDKGKLDVFLLKDRAIVHTDMKVDKQNKIDASVEINLDSKVEDLLKLIAGVDVYNYPLTGEVTSNAKIEIFNSDYRNANLLLNIQKLNLNRKDLRLDYASEEPELIVRGGQIEKWDIKAVGNKIQFYSTGRGNLYAEHLIEGKHKIDAEILEIFSDFITRSSGVLNINYTHKGTNGLDAVSQIYFTGDALSINSDKLPIPIRKMDFRISAKDLGLKVEELNIAFPTGNTMITGTIDLGALAPDVNLDMNMKNVSVPIVKRAQVTMDGDLSLIGKRPPYLFSGDLKIIKGDVLTELADIEGDSNFSKRDYQYLPKGNQVREQNLVALNIGVSSLNPIRVSNSLVRINLNTDLQITSGEKKPTVAGRIYPTAGEKKIFFKGNEFVINKANINFNPNEELTNPEIDFFAITSVGEYKVNVEAFGNLNDLNLRMSSDPSLPQEEVLSLVAFGYTDDISNNLSATDKDSMTRAGVGALIFDSLKINDALKSEFGLQVNLGTEITQDEGSYLSGRTEGGSGASRVRTATRVEIKKQLNDSMNLSVSSTVGGSVGQRQSMNLNYNLTNKLSIEGVYEMHTRDEGEEDNIDNSVGADLKFRWTHK